METINSLKKNHPVIFAFAVSFFMMLFLFTTKKLLGIFGILQNGTNIDFLIKEIIILAFSLFLAFATNQQHIFRCGTKNLLKGLWSGFVFFVLAGIGCSIFINDALSAGKTFKPASEIIAFIFLLIAIGAAEETVSRGIISDVLIEHFGKTKSGIWAATVLSGVIFGLTHITNVLSQSLGETIIQIIATSLTGILFSAIYIRHRNIYVPMILHSIFDFMTMTTQGLFTGESLAGNDIGADFEFFEVLKQSLISQGLFVIIAIFILRPKILKKLAEKNNAG